MVICANYSIAFEWFFQIFKDDQLPQHLCNGCESVVVNYYDRITTYEKLEKKWLSETSGQIKNVLEAVEVCQICHNSI